MPKKTPVLGIFIDSVDMCQAVAKVEEFILSKKPSLVATANAEMVMQAQKDATLFEILNKARLVVADGAGVVWAARYNGQPLPERVAGYDLAQRLLLASAQKGYRVFLFGAGAKVLEAAREQAELLYPGVQIVGVRHGFFNEGQEREIVEEIKAANPDILLAALGVPKQEKWLFKYLHDLNVPVCMGVGGSFDVMAGVVKRAPVWMQKMGLEWLYRLLKQPKRLGRMLALPQFVWKVISFEKKC